MARFRAQAGIVVLWFILTLPGIVQAQQTSMPDTVLAQAGEGIFSLLRRCERNPSTCLKDFILLNKENLGPDSSLYVGRSYLIPATIGAPQKAAPVTKEVIALKDSLPSPQAETLEASAKSTLPEVQEKIPEVPPLLPAQVHEPLFGRKYAEVKILDRKLQNAVYYLVAGHSGPDPGAIGKYGPYQLSEDEYAYDVTLRLARKLMEHGATVYMIVQDPDDGIRDEPILPMDTDELHYPDKEIPYNQKLRLRARVAAINALFIKHKGAKQRMLAIHIDSRSRGENIDVFFYHHENSPAGKALAENIHETFTRKYGRHQPNRAYHGSVSTRSSLYVVKYSHPPAVFIELGNIKNQRDQRRFVLSDNRQALANWIAEGILQENAN